MVPKGHHLLCSFRIAPNYFKEKFWLCSWLKGQIGKLQRGLEKRRHVHPVHPVHPVPPVPTSMKQDDETLQDLDKVHKSIVKAQ